MEVGAPDALKFEIHSGDIIATLQGLRDKAQGQLEEAKKARLWPEEAPSSELSPCPLLRPDAHEFQSLVVIEMLKKLLDKFISSP